MSAAEKKSLLHVAFPSNATMQQPRQNDATSYATTTQQPPAKTASLLDLARSKLRNNHATSSEKDVQQPPINKGEDVASIDEALEARQQRAIDLLEQNPDAKRAVVPDVEADENYVILTIAIRNVATFELMVAKDRYDPFQLLNLIDQQTTQATH